MDKFQGQQAPVVIYSMATSRPEDAPRGLEFLYSLNRLNVATSRAQCAVILVASPHLFVPDCSTPRQMKLANALCRTRDGNRRTRLTRRRWVVALQQSAAVPKVAKLKKRPATPRVETDFAEVVRLIEAARQRAFQSVNTTLIDLYWRVGQYISRKIESAAWGEAVVEQLAAFIARRHPEVRGFTRRNLFRMRQF